MHPPMAQPQRGGRGGSPLAVAAALFGALALAMGAAATGDAGATGAAASDELPLPDPLPGSGFLSVKDEAAMFYL